MLLSRARMPSQRLYRPSLDERKQQRSQKSGHTVEHAEVPEVAKPALCTTLRIETFLNPSDRATGMLLTVAYEEQDLYHFEVG